MNQKFSFDIRFNYKIFEYQKSGWYLKTIILCIILQVKILKTCPKSHGLTTRAKVSSKQHYPYLSGWDN